MSSLQAQACPHTSGSMQSSEKENTWKYVIMYHVRITKSSSNELKEKTNKNSWHFSVSFFTSTKMEKQCVKKTIIFTEIKRTTMCLLKSRIVGSLLFWNILGCINTGPRRKDISNDVREAIVSVHQSGKNYKTPLFSISGVRRFTVSKIIL